MDHIFISNFFLASCHVLIFSILLWIVKPLLRKHLDSIRLGAVWSILYTAFILTGTDRSSIDPLLRIPWPAPQISSSIAAFDQPAGTDWFAVIRWGWIAGSIASALILFVSHRMFLSLIRLDEQPCPAWLDSLADELYTEQLLQFFSKTYENLSDEKRAAKIERAMRRAKARPRIIISSAADGPAMPLFSSKFILLDRTDYPADDLKWILRHAFARNHSGVLGQHTDALLAWIILWFNPANWFLYRGSRAAAASKCDKQLLEDKTPEDQESYLRMLNSLTTDRPENLLFVRIGGSEYQIRDRAKQLAVQEEPFISDRGLAFIVAMIFFFIAPQIVQLDTRFPVTEQSVFCVLGTDEAQFLDTRHEGVDLISLEEDGLLYGAPYYSASSFNDKPVYKISLHYPNDASPEYLEASALRLLDVLTSKLGPPSIFEANGAPTNEIDRQIRLLLEAAGHPLPSENDRLEEKTPLHYQWPVTTKDGDSAVVLLRIRPGGAYWNEETQDGLLIEVVLQ